jgi:GNAT superfamily N-acetyltransferase
MDIERMPAVVCEMFNQNLDTSSIGSTMGIRQACDERLKGFENNLIITPSDLAEFEGMFREAQTRASDSPEITRTSIRAVMQESLLPLLSDYMNGCLEATIGIEKPIDGMKGYVLAYFGANTESRGGQRLDRSEYERRITNAEPKESETVWEKIRRVEHRFEVRPLAMDSTTDSERETIAGLLNETFGYTEEQTRRILDDQNHIVLGAVREGSIVGLVMAETAYVPLFSGGAWVDTLAITEETNVVTVPEWQGKGVHTLLAARLMAFLSQFETDIVCSESNLSSGARIHIVRRLGGQIHGMLPQAVTIADEEKVSLAVTSMSREALGRISDNFPEWREMATAYLRALRR